MNTQDPSRWRTVIRIWPSGSVEIVDRDHEDAAELAALILAAPDLLAACEALSRSFDAVAYAAWTPEMHAAVAAIAKAKGEL